MLKRKCLLPFLLVITTLFGVACSSNQDAIDRAVQETVEAQRVADTTPQPTPIEQVDNAEEETNEVVTPPVSDENLGENQSQSSLVERIVGKWSGEAVNGEATIDEDVSLTFYGDLVVFQSSERVKDIFFYDIVDADTIQLRHSFSGKASATLEVTGQSPDNLKMTLRRDRYPDSPLVYSLHKVADVEPENVGFIETAMKGVWTLEDYIYSKTSDIRIEVLANYFARLMQGSPLQLFFEYEFTEPNRMNLKFAENFADDQWMKEVDVAMPNQNTLVLWKYTDDGDQYGYEFWLIMHRVSAPMAAIKRSENEVLYPFRAGDSDSACGYIDHNGGVVVEPRFSSCGFFSEGLAYVGTIASGYIDNSGSFVIEPQFDWGGDFSEGLAAVMDRTTHQMGYIDKTGKYVISPQYDYASSFSDGMAHVRNDEPRWEAFIDTTGAVAFEFTPDVSGSGDSFHDGFQANYWKGYTDKTGKLVSSLNGWSFSEGLAAIDNEDYHNCYYVNKEFQTVIQTSFDGCREFSEGLAAVRRGNEMDSNSTCGYIDKDGELVIDMRFDGCDGFSEGRAIVKVGDYYGVIDTQGNYVLRPHDFDFISGFQDGLALVGTTDERFGYIDREGNYVWLSSD
jgi:hypothetical protein